MTSAISATVLILLLNGPAVPLPDLQADAAAASSTQATPPPSDRAVDPSQPDFTIIGLPTTLRVPKFRSAFRVTHRFTRSLNDDFGDVASDLFGIDDGAQIGLEFRFGLIPGTQIGIHRTSNRTIEFFGQHQLLRQAEGRLVSLDVIATVEGLNNFRHTYSPSIGAVVSRTLGRHGAVYVEPIWVANTNPDPADVVEDNSTMLIGLGARLRIRPTVYLVGEAIPRFGFEPDATHLSFGIEKRAGGHTFQLNFSNGIGTTMAQLARGGFNYDDWYMGFNISRKFF